MVDEREIKAFKEALDRFEDCVLDVLQTGRRFLLILQPKKQSQSQLPLKIGEFCRECGCASLIRTGTCMTCQNCGFNNGCE